MKYVKKATVLKSITLFLFTGFCHLVALAQDSTVSTSTTTVTTREQTWYTQPWVWVVGGAVLLLLLIALIRSNSSGNSRTDKVTYTKTTEKDT